MGVRTIAVKFVFADDEVLAVFPDFDEGRGMVMCYAHYGQHGTASKAYVAEARFATYDEYLPLLRELRSIYEADPNDPKLRVINPGHVYLA